MQPTIYLYFNGTCGDAMRFYGTIFASEPEFFTAGSVPAEDRAQMPDMPDDTVIHSAVAIGDGWIYASDDMSGDAVGMAGCDVSLTLPNVAETQRIFDALAAGGDVRQPLMPMFFSPAFGMVSDRFGTRWMLMTDTPDGTTDA